MIAAEHLRTALRAVAHTLNAGESTHGDEWRRLSALDHVAKVENHLRSWRYGDRNENHLANACARLLFAIELEQANETQGEAPR